MIKIVSHSRRQLRAVNQVLERVTAAELEQQTGLVTDDVRRVWGVDETRHLAQLDQGHVFVGAGTVSSTDLQRHRTMFTVTTH